MDSNFNYSQSCWEKIRINFDHKFNAPIVEDTTENKYARYMDIEFNEHIVSLFNSNQFDKSLFNRDLATLQEFLLKLKTKDSSQIHIVCTDYICSYSHRGYYHKKVLQGIKYYYLQLNLSDDPIPPIEDITSLLKNYTDYSKYKTGKSTDFHDPYSEKNIMRDLMNGDGEKHGFD
jgi:hypothetical protein